MILTIYNAKGEELYVMPAIYKDCVEKVTLMEEDYIELHFTLDTPVFFNIGAYCIWLGKRYVVTELQTPSYNTSNGGYSYELKMEAYYRAWKNKMLRYVPLMGGSCETSFVLCETLSTHVNLILHCLKYLGIQYNGQDFVSSIETNEEYDEAKTIEYSSENILDALTKIAEEYDAEWWINGNIINFGKCQLNDSSAIDFTIGDNVVTMESSKSEGEYATRVYAYGSDRNMPANYYKEAPTFSVKTHENGGFTADKGIYSAFFDEKWKEIISSDVSVEISSNGATQIQGTAKYNEPLVCDEGDAYVYKTSEVTLEEGAYTEGYGLKTSAIASAKLTNPDTAEFGSLEFHLIAKVKGIYAADTNKTEVILATKDFASIRYQDESSEPKTEYAVELPDFELTGECNVWIELWAQPLIAGDISSGNWSYSFAFSSEFTGTIEFTDKDPKTRVSVKCLFSEKEKNFYLYTDGQVLLPASESQSIPSIGSTFKITNLIRSKVPSSYFGKEVGKDYVNGITSNQLTLPSPGYIDIESGLSDDEIVEKVISFEDIYPRTEAKVAEVQTATYYEDDDNDPDTQIPYTRYYIKAESEGEYGFVFKSDFQLENGEALQIKFTTGALAGMTFETNFNPSEWGDNKTIPEDGNYFQIIRAEVASGNSGSLKWPNDIVHPSVGDKFVLIGWDASRLEDLGLIEKAQEELVKETGKELKKMAVDPNNYTCTMFSDFSYGKDAKGDLNPDYAKTFTLGRRVNLINTAFFKSGKRESRIKGWERKMDYLYDSPIYTVGEKANYSRIGEIAKNVESIAISSNGTQTLNKVYQEGAKSAANIIRTLDDIAPTDTSVFSSLRVDQDFLHSKKDDATEGQLTAEAGLQGKSSTWNDSVADGIIEYH